MSVFTSSAIGFHLNDCSSHYQVHTLYMQFYIIAFCYLFISAKLNFPSGSCYKAVFVCREIITHDFTFFFPLGGMSRAFYPEQRKRTVNRRPASTALGLFHPAVAMQQCEMLAQHDLDLLQQ